MKTIPNSGFTYRTRRQIQVWIPVLLGLIFLAPVAGAAERQFAGIVSSASPEATAAGVEILERGGNAIDAAVAVSLVLGVSEPAGSGIAGQTAMLVRRSNGESFVINGTTWSPRELPQDATREQLVYGRTAAAVPSTLRVLDLAWSRFGSGNLTWPDLLAPAIHIAESGFEIGPFRDRAFRRYSPDLHRQAEAAEIFVRPDGKPYQQGDVFRQPLLAVTLQRLSAAGAIDFYQGAIASEIVRDMQSNGGWITAKDLANFPEPAIMPALAGTYRGHDILTLPPPFGGWVVLQILNVLEQSAPQDLDSDNDMRRLRLLDALLIGHESRRRQPVTDFQDFEEAVGSRISKDEARRLLAEYTDSPGGETTHFSVVDGDGTAVAVTQSIDSYFGSKVVHPGLGFLYNNYMQGFQVEDPDAPYALEALQMPKSSMSATIVVRDGAPRLVLGSPGSARIISAVAQVTSYWIDVQESVESAVGAYRVHALPPDRAYVEGPEISPELLSGLASRGFRLLRPAYGVSDSQLDPYFGGVHALAFENGRWNGAADPRRDGQVAVAWRDID